MEGLQGRPASAGRAAAQAGYVEFGWEPKLTGSTRHRDDQGAGFDLNVVRELVLDLAYEPTATQPLERWELSEGDFANVDAFVAAVESAPAFQTALAAECIGSLVYEQEV